jgi:hypothetical protein
MRVVVAAIALVVALVVGLRPSGDGLEKQIELVRTPVTGGSPEQQQTVRAILAGLRAPSFARIVIQRASPKDRGLPEGSVELRIDGGPAARTSIRRQWEELLVAGAFEERSLATGLPPVVGYRLDTARVPRSGASTRRPVARGHVPPPGAAKALSELAYARVRRAGARLDGLDVLHPLGLALTIRLHVRSAGPFLERRLPEIIGALPGFRAGLDGFYVGVFDDHGLAAVITEARSSSGVRGPQWVRPELRGCLPWLPRIDLGRPLPACPT